jgi:phosphonate transport system substrate-binding protein
MSTIGAPRGRARARRVLRSPSLPRGRIMAALSLLRVAAMLLLALPLLASAASPVASVQRSDHVLVLGRISDDPERHHGQLQPLLDYIVPRMADVGVREGRILMARDAQQMASYLRRARVDWVTETAATGLVLAERSGAQVLVGTERDGVSLYESVIFVRRDSGIRTLDDLRGRSIAFQNLSSTSAYFAPAAAILGQGLPMEILLSPKDRPQADSVGYLFARSETNISTWVHKRLVDAGAFSDIDWNSLHRMPQAFRDDLVVIHSTPPFPRALEVVRAGLAADRRARLREILLAAGDDPDAREPLAHFFGTNRFVAIDGELEASLRRLAQDVRRVRTALE